MPKVAGLRVALSWLYTLCVLGIWSLTPVNAQASFGPQQVAATLSCGSGLSCAGNVINTLDGTPVMSLAGTGSLYQPLSGMAPYAQISAVPGMAPVQSVSGRTGAVVLTSADLSDFTSAAAAAAPVSSVNGSTGAVTGLETSSHATSTYCPLATCPSTTAMNAAISAAGYVFSIGAPTSKSPTFAAALQATNSAKPAIVTLNWTSTATISLSGGSTNSATVGIGSTSALAITGATVVCSHTNSNTGALTIGLSLNTIMATTCTFPLPAGWYWSPKLVAGTVTLSSAYDQSAG